ncbi:MAG TPA: hypothetical protein VFB06_34415 [Streptosporangiaceae bacterium]|nr:hypothetical protein [Streptosporangiaceae bacterium]
MKATHLMIAAFAIGILGNWAHGKQTVTLKSLVQAVFALLVIAALDQGRTQDIAKGLAGLFLVAVLLGNNSPLTAIAKITGGGAVPEKNVNTSQEGK